MINFILFKIDITTLEFWFFRILFLGLGIVYVIYVLLQIRQIGIMNSTLKTRSSLPIGIISIIHLFLVIGTITILEIVLFFQA